jgi:hypothetical protein
VAGSVEGMLGRRLHLDGLRPRLRNRLGAVLNGERMTEEEFAKARSFKGNDASMADHVGW